MKHISFDESTVLGELARIASETGLVKEAAGSPVQSLMQAVSQAAPSGPSKVVYDGLLQELQQNIATKDVSGLGEYLAGRYTDPKLQGLIKQHLMPAAVQANGGRYFDIFKTELGKVGATGALKALEGWQVPPNTDPNKLKESLVAQFKDLTPVLSIIDRVFKPTVNAALETDPVTKNAEGKLYDVSGETGEQLVDSAHPGGGTKTELTHSKTDENLVETIVEQQKRDIEVAQKVPKGTYAALKDLHTKLEKLGADEKYLNRLSKIIDSVYTPDEFVRYKLAKLSDDLDAIGDYTAANRVDEIHSLALEVDPSKFPGAAKVLTEQGMGLKNSRMLHKVRDVGKDGLSAEALLFTIPAAAIAGYFILDYLRAAENTLGDLINRLKALDPNENFEGTISGWISTLQRMKSKMVIPPASPDPDIQKQIAQQRAKDLQDVAGQLAALQGQWPQIEANLKDIGFDKSQAKSVLDQTSARIGQLAQQVSAKLPQVWDAAEKQKQKQEEETGKPGKGELQTDTKKPKGSWRQRVVTDFASANRFAHWYNKIIGEAGEHDTAIPVSDEARVSKTVTKQMRGGIEKALARIGKVGSGKEWAKQMREGREVGADAEEHTVGADAEEHTVGDRSAEDLKMYRSKVSETAKKMRQYGWDKLDEWTGLPKSEMSIKDAKQFQNEIMNSAHEILSELAPYYPGVKVPQFSGAEGIGLAEQLKDIIVKKYKTKG